MHLNSVLWGVSHTLINTVCESKYAKSRIGHVMSDHMLENEVGMSLHVIETPLLMLIVALFPVMASNQTPEITYLCILKGGGGITVP